LIKAEFSALLLTWSYRNHFAAQEKKNIFFWIL